MKDKRLKTTTVTWILAIVWLITALIPPVYYVYAIGKEEKKAQEFEQALANLPQNSIEDTVTALIDIDLTDDMVRSDSVFSDILSEPDRSTGVQSEGFRFSCMIHNPVEMIKHYKFSLVAMGAYILCGIAMSVAFRKTSWLKYAYVAMITFNLCIIPLAELAVPLCRG